MIKMIIAPLIFSTLVVGIAGTGDLKAVGRIGLKAILWFELATTIALVIGLVMVNVIRPGAGVVLPTRRRHRALTTMAHSQQGRWDILLHLVPTSVVDAMAKNDILQVVVFACFFGVALAAVGARGAVDRRPARQRGARDVQGHGLRHAVRADRRARGHGGDRRRQGARHPRHARQAGA